MASIARNHVAHAEQCALVWHRPLLQRTRHPTPLGGYKRLKLTQLLGQLGVFLTRACCTGPSRLGFLVVTAAAAAAAPGVGCAGMPSLTLADAAARRFSACLYAASQLVRLAAKSSPGPPT